MAYGKNYRRSTDFDDLARLMRSFEGHLQTDQVYGSVGGGFLTGGNAPQLTVGAVLLRLRRLRILERDMSDMERVQIGKLARQHAELCDEYADDYIMKLEREAMSRLNAMSRFFEECRQSREVCARQYNPEVLRRTIVEEIRIDMGERGLVNHELDQLLAQTDKRLRSWIVESEFVWDAQLVAVYPKERFWWMWMSPQVWS